MTYFWRISKISRFLQILPNFALFWQNLRDSKGFRRTDGRRTNGRTDAHTLQIRGSPTQKALRAIIYREIIAPKGLLCRDVQKIMCVRPSVRSFVRPFVRSHVLGSIFGPQNSRFPFDGAIWAVQKGVPSVTFRTRSDLTGSRSARKMMTTPHQIFQRTIITYGRHNPSTKVPLGPPCPAGEI